MIGCGLFLGVRSAWLWMGVVKEDGWELVHDLYAMISESGLCQVSVCFYSFSLCRAGC